MATGTVRIEGKADLASVNRAVDKLTGNLKKARREAASLATKAKAAGQALAPVGAAAAAGAVALGALVDKTLRTRLEMSNLASQANISAKLMGTLSVSAERAGVSADQITGSMKALTVAAYEASKGNQGAIDKFDALGVSVMDASGELKGTEVLFRDVVGGLGDIENSTERSAAAQVLMGEGAAGLQAALGDLSDEGLAKAETASRAFTGHLTEEGIKAAEDYQAQITKLSVAMQSVGDLFADFAGPILGGVVDSVAFASVFLSESLSNALKTLGEIVNIQTTRFIGLGQAIRALASGGPEAAAAVMQSTAAAVKGLEDAAGLSYDPLANLDLIFGKAARTADKVVAKLNATTKSTTGLKDALGEGGGGGGGGSGATGALIEFVGGHAELLEYQGPVADGFGALTAGAVEYGLALGAAAMEEARLQEQRDANMASLDGIVSLTGKASDALGEYIKTNEDAPQALKVAAAAMFALNKAAAISSAIVNTALSVTAALTIPPPAGPVLAGVNAAAGAVQIATIAAEQPSFASGGVMPSTGGPATLHPGEGVISAGAVDRMGGESALAAMNSRSAMGGGGSVTVQWKHLRQSFALETREASRRPGPMREVRRDGRRAGRTARLYRPDYGGL